MKEQQTGKQIQKWADNAMFAAEPMADAGRDGGPKVYLLSMTPDPLGTIAAVNKMYIGQTVRSLTNVTDEERHKHWQEVSKTRLKAPFEFVQFHFMIEGVTRAFTHQMVRQRTATFAQESLRFAVKEDMADSVGLPPSLSGTTGEAMQIRAELMATYGVIQQFFPSDNGGREPHPSWAEWEARFDRLPDEEKQRYRWDLAVGAAGRHYLQAIEDGMPAEDARGLLPTNTLTRLHYRTNLRDLLEHAGMRLCTQAQFEWRLVWAQMLKAIRNYGANMEAASDEVWSYSPAHEQRPRDGWQYGLIAKLFKPICYQTGKCEFMGAYDRACSIRNRVEANHDIGRPSKKWGYEYDAVKGNPVVSGVGPHSVLRESEGGEPVFIGAISPVEWIADPTAARHNKGGHLG